MSKLFEIGIDCFGEIGNDTGDGLKMVQQLIKQLNKYYENRKDPKKRINWNSISNTLSRIERKFEFIEKNLFNYGHYVELQEQFAKKLVQTATKEELKKIISKEHSLITCDICTYSFSQRYIRKKNK